MKGRKIEGEETGGLASSLNFVSTYLFNDKLKLKLSQEGKEIISREFIGQMINYYNMLSQLTGFIEGVTSPTQKERFRGLIKDINEHGALENITDLAYSSNNLLKQIRNLNKTYKRDTEQLSIDIQNLIHPYKDSRSAALSYIDSNIKKRPELGDIHRKIRSYDHLKKINFLDPRELIGDRFANNVAKFNKQQEEYIMLIKQFFREISEIRDNQPHNKFLETSSIVTSKQEQLIELKARRVELVSGLNSIVERIALYDPLDKELTAVKNGSETAKLIYNAAKTLPPYQSS